MTKDTQIDRVAEAIVESGCLVYDKASGSRFLDQMTAAKAAIDAMQPEEQLHKVQEMPAINQFRINPIGEGNIEVEGNEWFCHAYEVKAYKIAAEALMDEMAEALELMEEYSCMCERWQQREGVAYVTKLQSVLTKYRKAKGE